MCFVSLTLLNRRFIVEKLMTFNGTLEIPLSFDKGEKGENVKRYRRAITSKGATFDR